jgi:hypothetical protein
MREAGGMAAQLFRLAAPYGIEVLSGGGFDSTSNKHRLAQYYGGDVEVVKGAITPEQARFHELPAVPPKPTDNRAAHFTDSETWQAEALDPNDLARYLEEAILDPFDLGIYEPCSPKRRKSGTT